MNEDVKDKGQSHLLLFLLQLLLPLLLVRLLQFLVLLLVSVQFLSKGGSCTDWRTPLRNTQQTILFQQVKFHFSHEATLSIFRSSPILYLSTAYRFNYICRTNPLRCCSIVG